MILLDIAATTVAVLLSAIIRFGKFLQPWQVQLYSTIYFITILLYMAMSTFRLIKQHDDSIADMDAGEIFFTVVRDRILEYILLIFLLALSGSFSRTSRIMLLLMGMYDCVFCYLGRMIVRYFVRRSSEKITARKYYLIITTKEQKEIALRRLYEGLPKDAQYIGTQLVEPNITKEKLFVILQDGICSAEEIAKKAGKKDKDIRVFVYLRGTKYRGLSDEVVTYYREREIPVFVQMFAKDQELPRSMISQEGVYTTAEYLPLKQDGDVFGVHFSATHIGAAVFTILDKLQTPKGTSELSGKYLCFSNVHTTVMAHDDPEYRKILNGAYYTFPDGWPIASYLKRLGFETERVAGPDFMDAMFRATMDGKTTHYFYGSTTETIEKLGKELTKRYPGIKIMGLVSPPFRPETKEEDENTIRLMNESGADLIWVGLGAPKQEKWMMAHENKVNGLMLGVGAGFNFYAGTIKRAPKWIQKLGMEWLYRLIQDPRRLVNRYIVTNAKFVWYMILDSLKF